MTSRLPPLPVGIQDFAQLREGGFVYVDKTEIVHQLVTTSKSVFLSRPRRFGKSLLISVFQNLYQGRKDLFKGLWIENQWDWTKTHPVVRISFGTGKFQERGELVQRQRREVDREALRLDVDLNSPSSHGRFSQLLETLSARGPKPVVLIDEYDKPILQCLEGMREISSSDPSLLEAHEEELSVLEENRQDLRAFYSCLKDASPEFLFMTGVSRLAKASVFSELNHLKDITWTHDYATLCGITQAELERDFANHLEAMASRQKMSLAQLVERIQKDYNGFRFATGDDVSTVYNPFSTCCCLDSKEFGSYWTETGTPEFLVRLMRGSGTELSDVEGRWLPISDVSSLDPSHPDVLPLLLQTGYLTITGWQDDCYRLGFPNKEVRTAFVEHLLRATFGRPMREIAPRAQALAKALLAGHMDPFIAEMKRVYTGIAYQLDDATEKRYHGLFQAMCNLALCPPALILAEVPNALGRSDLVVDLPEVCYLFEFKRDTDTADALAQMALKEYENQWEGRLLPDGSAKPVRKVAVTFETKERNILAWEAV